MKAKSFAFNSVGSCVRCQLYMFGDGLCKLGTQAFNGRRPFSSQSFSQAPRFSL